MGREKGDGAEEKGGGRGWGRRVGQVANLERRDQEGWNVMEVCWYQRLGRTLVDVPSQATAHH